MARNRALDASPSDCRPAEELAMNWRKGNQRVIASGFALNALGAFLGRFSHGALDQHVSLALLCVGTVVTLGGWIAEGYRQ